MTASASVRLSFSFVFDPVPRVARSFDIESAFKIILSIVFSLYELLRTAVGVNFINGSRVFFFQDRKGLIRIQLFWRQTILEMH